MCNLKYIDKTHTYIYIYIYKIIYLIKLNTIQEKKSPFKFFIAATATDFSEGLPWHLFFFLSLWPSLFASFWIVGLMRELYLEKIIKDGRAHRLA